MNQKKLLKKISESTLRDSEIEAINQIIEKSKIPTDVLAAMEYIKRCESDMGFMGSPKYYEAIGLVEKYNQSK